MNIIPDLDPIDLDHAVVPQFFFWAMAWRRGLCFERRPFWDFAWEMDCIVKLACNVILLRHLSISTGESSVYFRRLDPLGSIWANFPPAAAYWSLCDPCNQPKPFNNL